MKRAFVTGVDTYVGKRVCAKFAATGEYDVTGTCRDPAVAAAAMSGTTPVANVKTIIRGYHTDPVGFKEVVLDSDVVICTLVDDSVESAAALRMLSNTTFNVEKTYVLVSSTQSWANTHNAVLAELAAEKAAERAALIAAGEEPPEEEDAPPPEEEEEVPSYTEDMYAKRVAHPRYQHWKEVEHYAKAANSETLHTFVIFAGLTYGEGEDLLHPLFRDAWHHKPLPMYTKGTNVVPMIHVEDLANLIFKVGTVEDVQQQRYILGVDRGNVTWSALVKAVNEHLGSGETVHITSGQQVLVPNLEHFTIDVKLEGGAIASFVDEDAFVSVDGIVANIEKVVAEFKASRMVTPVRAHVMGPSLSGKTVLSSAIAEKYKVKRLDLPSVIEAYKEHANDLQSTLADIRQKKKEEKKRLAILERKEAKRLAAAQAAEEAAAAAAEAGENGEGAEQLDGSMKGSIDKAPGAGEAAGEEEEVEFDEETPEGFQPGQPDEGNAAAAPAVDEDGNPIEAEAEDKEPTPEELDDEEDEVLNKLKEDIAYATRVLGCKKVLPAPVPDAAPSPKAHAEEAEEPSATAADPYDQPATTTPTKAGSAQGTPRDAVPEAIAVEEAPTTIERYDDAALAVMVRWRLGQKDCQNQGYIFDGYPKTVAQAQLAFVVGEVPLPEPVEEGEDAPPPAEEEPPTLLSAADDKFLPELVVVINADMELLKLRQEAASEADPARYSLVNFYRRMEEYAERNLRSNKPVESLVAWFTAMLSNVEGAPRDVAVAHYTASDTIRLDNIGKLLGPGRYYRPTPTEIIDAEKQKYLDAKRAAEDEAVRLAKEDEARKQQDAARTEQQRVNELRYRTIAVEKKEAELIGKIPSQEYLMSHVVPALIKGMALVTESRSPDPIDTLADFLYRYDPKPKLQTEPEPEAKKM